MRSPSVSKRADEHRAFEINLGPAMRPTDSVAAVTRVDAGPDITVDAITHTSGVVTFRAAGGTAGTTYPAVVHFVTAGSPEQTLEACFNIVVLPGC